MLRRHASINEQKNDILKEIEMTTTRSITHPPQFCGYFPDGHFRKAPCNSNSPDTEKINGHNLNGKKAMLKPVNSDNTAIENSINAHETNTTFTVVLLSLFVIVSSTASSPINSNVSPSLIHSIRIILVLSGEIAPNPFTTEFVGNRWAIPQMIFSNPPITVSILLSIISSWAG